jgi:serine/threonine protein phosphatase PrpC
LTDAVSVETLANILALPRDTQWIARQLVASALEHGSKDNATAVVVQCCAQSASASDVWPPRPLRSARRPA